MALKRDHTADIMCVRGASAVAAMVKPFHPIQDRFPGVYFSRR
jgi:hypothetical protein